MLKIQNLKTEKENKQILKGLDLTLEKGKTYVLMGPNGSGKSTLAKTLSGDPSYKVSEGSISWEEESLLEKKPEELALQGIFISYQHPPEIPGLNISQYLRQIYNKKHDTNLNPAEFANLLEEKFTALNLPKEFKNRYLNEGFSGGEKKKMEILQMLLLKPKIAILDEIDSGVDVDALKVIIEAVKNLQNNENTTILYITHYPSLLEQVEPEKIFLMKEGKIVKEGREDLARQIREEGYAEF
ncbi:Fe-S cluster assembly ATPase SufC [candidate division WWE3 bacterium]|nr:Fe-S cluster assembly ATPase SufC [candidate division WWE3 bacterium]